MVARVLVGLMFLIAVAMAAGWVYFKGHGTGYDERDLQCKAEVAAIETVRIEAERQATMMRDAARKLADRLAAQALAYESKLAESSRRLQDAIRKKASPVRRAFTDDSITRMLNEQAVIREYVDGKPVAPSPGVDAADARHSEDRAGSASERALAEWGAKMIAYAQTCRTRLHGLQAWAKEVAR